MAGREIRRRAKQVDSMDFFNLITGPELLERLEALLPEYRERKFPPTVTLAMFLGQVRGVYRKLPKVAVSCG